LLYININMLSPLSTRICSSLNYTGNLNLGCGMYVSAKLATRMGIVDQDTLAGIENIINA
ncbi:MAG: hypothetical protein KJ741_08670, partial [Proteobacteria bacterium]|nr:hypothetical protein [Pseudomonadota bacterium]